MNPDERVLRQHLEEGPFQSGIANNRWQLIEENWPFLLVAVTAATRERSPSEYAFRFQCENYPATAPTAQPWDTSTNKPLAHNQWPTGRERVPAAFNPGWKNGQCLYLPCDRIAMQGHNGWVVKYPHMLWSVSGDITQYLNIIYELLNSNDYTGVRCA